MKIIKRDGRLAEFDQEKIKNAILKAFVAVDGELTDYAISKADNIAAYVKSSQGEERYTVDQIQDLVEKGLMATRRKDVAKAYITYRYERDKVRTRNSALRQNVLEKLNAKNVQNQNANVDERSFGGRMGEANSVQMRDVAINDLLSPMARHNHLNNIIYIHDLDAYAVGSHNCLTIPFDDLLAKGFNSNSIFAVLPSLVIVIASMYHRFNV